MRVLAIACVFAAACGGDDGVRHLGDAPPVPDAPSIDAALSGPVSLQLTLDGRPQAGVTVYFQDAASVLIAATPTAADGTATATMEPGGFVTVIQPFPSKGGSHDVRTFAGVKPGDQLKIDESNGGGTPIDITLTVPFDANANMYDVDTSCSGKYTLIGGGAGSGSGSTPSGTLTLSGCAGFADVLVQTFDIGGAPLGWFYHPNLAVADQQVITLTDTYDTTTPINVTMMFASVPAAYSSLAFRNVVASPRGPVFDGMYATDVTAGAASLTFPRPPVAGAVSVTAIHPTPTNSIGSHVVVEWGAAATVAFDLTGALLPLYEIIPTFAIATHAVSWTAGAGAAPDFVIAEVYAERFTAAPNAAWRWRIVAPYATTIAMPVLPAAVAEYNIVAGDGPLPDGPIVEMLNTAKVPGGYDAVRARLHSLRTAADLEGLVTGATGRIVYEMLESQQPL